MLNLIIIILGRLIAFASRVFNLGHGSTWPGHVALNVNRNFIKDIIKLNPQLKIILIVGTNGKTTTGKLIQTILEKSGKKVFQNESGANLLNGTASSMLLHSSILCKINYDYAIFEVDENTLPLVLKELTADYLILLNLFRDQLDRYGEVNTIALKWEDAIRHLLPKTKLILNADDPQIAHLGLSSNVIPVKTGIQIPDPNFAKLRWARQVGNDKDNFQQARTVFYFGLNDKQLHQDSHQHAVDSTYCPNCNSKLFYNTIYYSHLGDWGCKNCDYKRPKNIFSSPPPCKLSGTYNLYNVLAAVLVAKKIGTSDEKIKNSLKTFTPAFGRQEILSVDGKKIQMFLSKNPTSFNESLRTIKSFGAKNVLFALNDRIPDGRDVSWIWDVDFEDYSGQFKSIIISGDRCYDMGLRIKYNRKSQNHISNLQIFVDLDQAIKKAFSFTNQKETLYILPTYSAMLEVRNILTGKKIL